MTDTKTAPASRADILRARAEQARAAGRAVHGHPLRDQAAPHAALGVLVLAGTALHAAASASPDRAEILAGTAATCVVISIVAATFTRRRVADKKMRRRAIAAFAVIAGWLPLVTATGVTTDTVLPLVLVGFALAAHWWRLKRIPNTAVAAPAAPAAPRPDQYASLWAEHLGGPGCVLAGTRLANMRTIDAGTRYDLHLVPGKMSMGTVQAQMDNLRTGLRLKKNDQLVIEEHPNPDRDASCLQITIVTRSPVRDSVEHPGLDMTFDPATGCVSLGPFIDGEGVAQWKAYTGARLMGGFLGGGTNAGKSRMIEGVAMALANAETHPTVVWFGDGQGGASSPLLKNHADHFAGTFEHIHAQLMGMLLIVELRQDENVVDDMHEFQPTPDRPGLLGVLDECQKIFSKLANPLYWEQCQYAAGTIAAEGGKVGVALILASQQTTLDAFGGAQTPNAERIRSNLLVGNGICLRSKDPNAKQVFGIDINPKTFPKMPGYAWVVDPEEGARSAPFRGYFLTDAQRDTWPHQINWRSLDVGAANAYGDEYLRRHELAAQAIEERRRRVEARRRGQANPQGTQLRKVVPAGGDGPSAADFGILTFPVWDPTDPAKFAVAPSAKPVKELHDGHRKVLDAMRAGCQSPKAIQDATGYGERQVYNLLRELIDMVRVRKDGRGAYLLINDGQVAA